MTDAYRRFLEAKAVVAPSAGFEVDPGELNPDVKGFVREIVRWAASGGRRAIFSSFGLHKTSAQLELSRLALRRDRVPLIVLPLGVRQEFAEEAEVRFRGDFAIRTRFIRSTAEADEGAVNLTNYDSVLDGKVDPQAFGLASLDEAAVLRSYGSKTFQEFLPLFEPVPWRFVATAVPAPNRVKELIHYAGFLGIMDTGQALTRFFQRNASKANDLQLYPHKVDEFWHWVASWAVFLQRPSDLGFSDDGYELPPVTVNWHEVPIDHGLATPERDGQGVLIRDAAVGVTEAAAAKRESLDARIERMQALIAEDPEAHRIIWHDLEVERLAIEKAVPGVRSIYGGQALEANERNALDFKHGRLRDLATKPVMSGAGPNWQAHCAWAIFLGIGYKFHDFIQAIHRIARFGQGRACRIDIIYSEAEREVRRELERKWTEDVQAKKRMRDIIRRYGLGNIRPAEVLQRSIGVERREEQGEGWAVAHNDCVAETTVMETDSVGLVVTSIPFANQYEYCASYNDFGHTDDNAHFWDQMGFLTPELLRVLQPGRLACVHVKDRILFGAVTGAGAPTVSPFHAEAIFHYRRLGFDYMGMITVVTDVVRENNQTYRLGYTEMLKDGTKMAVGSPEYVLLLRKPQSDRSRGYADLPVTKDPAQYSLARWQVDAHAFWRSSGNRLLTPEELVQLPADKLVKYFTQASLAQVYDHDAHVALGEAIEARRKGSLPRTFMALAPGSHDAGVWHDVNRMATLNADQAAKGWEKHVCPLQFDIVDRLITRYSNPGELVFDPFGGLFTVPVRALKLKRRGRAVELNPVSFQHGLAHVRATERDLATPTLFDLDDGPAEAPGAGERVA